MTSTPRRCSCRAAVLTALALSLPGVCPAAASDAAGGCRLTVQLQPEQVRLGEHFWLELRVAGKAGSWQLPEQLDLAPATVLDRQRDHRQEQGRDLEVLRLRLAIYEHLGQVSLPAFELRSAAGSATCQVPATTIKVASMLSDDAEPTPADIAGPVEIRVPDYRLLAAGGLLLAWLALAGLLWWRRFTPVPEQPPLEPLPPELGAEEIARRQLRQIMERDLVRQGRYQEFFDAVSDTLREYLGNRYGFFALDLTTPELLAWLRDRPTPGLDLGLLRRLLEEADLVKFARVQPSDEMCSRAIDGALQVVAATTHSLAGGQAP